MNLDTQEYTTLTDYYQDDGNGYHKGYEQLDGKWALYYKIALKYAHKARFEDRQDLLHTIMLNLAVADGKDGHKPDNLSWAYRIASFTVA